MNTHRRGVVQLVGAGLLGAALTGCGFKLRSSQNFAFQTLAVTPEKGGLVATDVIRYFGSGGRATAGDSGCFA